MVFHKMQKFQTNVTVPYHCIFSHTCMGHPIWKFPYVDEIIQVWAGSYAKASTLWMGLFAFILACSCSCYPSETYCKWFSTYSLLFIFSTSINLIYKPDENSVLGHAELWSFKNLYLLHYIYVTGVWKPTELSHCHFIGPVNG